MQSPYCPLLFELMCNASDYDVGAALGQRKKKVSYLLSIMQVEFLIVPK